MVVKFKMKLQKIGASLRVTIPQPVAETLNLKAGDILDLYLDNSHIVIAKSDTDTK
jgi:AbrB family looped-hinge helix DNA binding protein